MCEKKSLEKKLADQLKKGIKQGKEEGIKQGKEEGIKQGKEEGIKQGKEEGIRQSEIKQIKNLLDLGVERSKIVSFLEIVTEEEFDYICQHKNDNILDILKFLDKKRS